MFICLVGAVEDILWSRMWLWIMNNVHSSILVIMLIFPRVSVSFFFLCFGFSFALVDYTLCFNLCFLMLLFIFKNYVSILKLLLGKKDNILQSVRGFTIHMLSNMIIISWRVSPFFEWELAFHQLMKRLEEEGEIFTM